MCTSSSRCDIRETVRARALSAQHPHAQSKHPGALGPRPASSELSWRVCPSPWGSGLTRRMPSAVCAPCSRVLAGPPHCVRPPAWGPRRPPRAAVQRAVDASPNCCEQAVCEHGCHHGHGSPATEPSAGFPRTPAVRRVPSQAAQTPGRARTGRPPLHGALDPPRSSCRPRPVTTTRT